MSRLQQLFPFLDLPLELRMIVYSQITPSTHYHVLIDYDHVGKLHTTNLVRQSLLVSLLATSHQIHDEAQPYINQKLQYLKKQTLVLVVDRYSATALVAEYGPHLHIACFGIEPKISRWWPPKNRKPPFARKMGADTSHMLPLLTLGTSSISKIPKSNIHIEDLESFSNLCTTILARTLTAALTGERPYDIEIRLNGEIGDWDDLDMAKFMFQWIDVSGATDAAVVVYGKNTKDGVPYVLGTGQARTANESWCLFQGGNSFGRPSLSLLDLP
jgi:hypothetical protein